MKVLFDHNVPHKLRRSLAAHEVKTADEMAWSELENGDLLDAAEQARFDVMVTADKNISYQQNLENRKLALVVLSTNNWQTIRENPALVEKAVNEASRGSFQLVALEPRSARARRLYPAS